LGGHAVVGFVDAASALDDIGCKALARGPCDGHGHAALGFGALVIRAAIHGEEGAREVHLKTIELVARVGRITCEGKRGRDDGHRKPTGWCGRL
jgi:hypothetical protein